MLSPQNVNQSPVVLPVIKDENKVNPRSMNRLLSLNEFKLERHLLDQIPSKKDLNIVLDDSHGLEIPKFSVNSTIMSNKKKLLSPRQMRNRTNVNSSFDHIQSLKNQREHFQKV